MIYLGYLFLNRYLASITTGSPLTTQNTIANTAAQKPIVQIISLFGQTGILAAIIKTNARTFATA